MDQNHCKTDQEPYKRDRPGNIQVKQTRYLTSAIDLEPYMWYLKSDTEQAPYKVRQTGNLMSEMDQVHYNRSKSGTLQIKQTTGSSQVRQTWNLTSETGFVILQKNIKF